MKPLFKCELNYYPSQFLSQIYDGFEKLRKIGIVDIILKPVTGNASKPLLTVKINDKYTLIYDTLDGLNWIEGSIQDNLNYFKNSIQADFYFKRSYNKQVLEYAPQNCKVYPLGLNIPFTPEGRFPKDIKESIKNIIKENYFVAKYYKKSSFDSKDFEFFPIPCKVDKIFFITRLWNPEEVSLANLKTGRELINKNRIDCIKACHREFGKQFTGGLQKNNFTINNVKDLILPFYLTKREGFLNAIKEHNICIATTGLHNSITWKVPEYVSASRAIISEPLQYELPGDFENEKNYFIFSNEDQLLNKIHFLLNNRDVLFDMMNSNYKYYNNYLRPDKLVLNTLLRIYEND